MISLPYSQEQRANKKDVFIAAVAQGCSITSAAVAAGTTRGTAHNWLNDDQKFRERFYGAQENQNDLVEDALFKKTQEGNIGAIVFWKCNRQPHLWRSVNRIEVTAAPGALPLTSDLTRLSITELDHLEALLAKAERDGKAIETTAKEVESKA